MAQMSVLFYINQHLHKLLSIYSVLFLQEIVYITPKIRIKLKHDVETYVYLNTLSFHILSALLQTKFGQWSITANLWPFNAYIYHVMIIVTSGFS